MREIARAYDEALRRIRPQIDALMRQIEGAQTIGEIVNVGWLRAQRARLEGLEAQIEREIGRFAVEGAHITTGAQALAIEQAVEHAGVLIRTATGEARARVSTNAGGRLNGRAVEAVAGFASDGSPLRALFDALGASASQAARARLIEGVTLGRGTREIAASMQGAFDGNLARALTVARTETLRSYREATRETYAANDDVLSGYVWQASHSARTCAMCWAMSGTVFETAEVFSTHPNCRCVMLPVSRKNPITVKGGVEAFAELDAQTQRAILGAGKFEAYRRGDFTLNELVATRRDPRWGLQRFERSLRDLTGKR